MATVCAGRKSKKRRLKTTDLSDVICPICISILIEPVTLPCRHELCVTCLKQHIQESLVCPVCRLRISVWLRRQKSLVNKERWSEIKTLFPEAVRKRLKGVEDSVVINESTGISSLSKPGEIRKEYEEELKRFQEEMKRQREEEDRASEELIEKLREEEKRTSERIKRQNQLIAAKDEIIVKKMYKKMKKNNLDDTTFVNEFLGEAIPTVSGDKMVNLSHMQEKGIKASDMPSSSSSVGARARSHSADSHDSISPEMHHFKPIKSAPLTPPKRLPDGKFLRPKVIHSTPQRLDFDSQWNTMSNFNPAKHCKLLLEKLEFIDIERNSFQPYGTKMGVDEGDNCNVDNLASSQTSVPFVHRENTMSKHLLVGTLKAPSCTSKLNIDAKENIELSRCQQGSSKSSGNKNKLVVTENKKRHITEILEQNECSSLKIKEALESRNKRYSDKSKCRSNESCNSENCCNKCTECEMCKKALESKGIDSGSAEQNTSDVRKSSSMKEKIGKYKQKRNENKVISKSKQCITISKTKVIQTESCYGDNKIASSMCSSCFNISSQCMKMKRNELQQLEADKALAEHLQKIFDMEAEAFKKGHNLGGEYNLRSKSRKKGDALRKERKTPKDISETQSCFRRERGTRKRKGDGTSSEVRGLCKVR